MDFAGNWRIARRIDDHRQGRIGALTGVAEFAPSADGLIYTETGTLRFPGQADLSAKQSYLWSEVGAGLLVRFSDGRAFHTIDLATNNADAFHNCPPDEYRVAYEFGDWPEWTARWTVTGPAKNYEMTTTYLR